MQTEPSNTLEFLISFAAFLDAVFRFLTPLCTTVGAIIIITGVLCGILNGLLSLCPRNSDGLSYTNPTANIPSEDS